MKKVFKIVRKNRRRGFTLLEIMIVVMIIGFLATLTGTLVINRLKTAKLKIADTWVNGTGAQALNLYFTDNGIFPTTDQGLMALVKKPTSSPVPHSWTEPYMKEMPVDPWNNPYNYKRPSEHGNSDFDLWSSGPDGISGSEDDIGNWADDSDSN